MRSASSGGSVDGLCGVFGVDDCSSSRYSLLYLGRSSSSPTVLMGRPFVPSPLLIALFSKARPNGSFLGVNTSVVSSSPAALSSPPKDSREDLLDFFFPFRDPDRLIAGRTTTGPSSSSSFAAGASPRPSLSAGLKLFLSPDCRNGLRPAFAPNTGLTGCGSVIARYLDKRLFVQLNGSRKVIGILRGYDVFLNIVLDEAVEEKDGGEKERIGMVVIRGNSVVMLEALERIGGDDRRGDR
ncbi:hypothetical protein LB504_000356 [Fusarium proliferatum]|nr:hypothetical protein LB504_000356 [Fusarium proliferatum]